MRDWRLFVLKIIIICSTISFEWIWKAKRRRSTQIFHSSILSRQRHVSYRIEYKSIKPKIWEEIQHYFLFHLDHQRTFPEQDISISLSSHTPWSWLDIGKGSKIQSIPYSHHCMILIAYPQYFGYNWLHCGKIGNVSKDSWSGRWH